MARKGAEGNARQEHLSCVEHILTLPQRQSHLCAGARKGPLSSVQKKKKKQRGVLLSKVEGNYVSFGTFGMLGGLEFKLSVLTASSG